MKIKSSFCIIFYILFIAFTSNNINLLFAGEKEFNLLKEKYRSAIITLSSSVSAPAPASVSEPADQSKSSEIREKKAGLERVLKLFEGITSSDESVITTFKDDLAKNAQASADLNSKQLTNVLINPLTFRLLKLPSENELPTYEQMVQGFDHLRGIFKIKKVGTKTTTAAVVASATAVNAPVASVVPEAALSHGLYQIADTKFFTDLADAIEKNRDEFVKILTKLDNYPGAQYEITQVLKTLRGVKAHEWPYLKQIEGMKNAAIYGARNIPLYTTIMHALIPAVAVKDVWFRTPQNSRQVYLDLFDKIKLLMPEYDLSNVHMLTESKDVQYDNFLKKYILGLNKKGNAFEDGKGPADAVIFIGSPDTAKEIQEQIYSKLDKLKATIGPFKQIFLKFGSGLNPVIVTEYARSKQVDRAVDGVIEALRVNNSQDCIAPKFYAVHSLLYSSFIDKLMKSVKALKYGEQDDSNADYSKLSFTEDLTPLAEFRDRYFEYLLNKDAKIDIAKRIVEPHVFSFPYSMFKDSKVELKDHYAPFVILFKYENGNTAKGTELGLGAVADSKGEPASLATIKEIANDPRVQERAMYASIYGDSGSTDMWKIRKQFEDNFHSTVVNMSVYDEESGNFPFGGYGGTASSVTYFHKSKDGRDILSPSSYRPLLFSKEAARFFTISPSSLTSTSLADDVTGITIDELQPATKSDSYYVTKLKKVIEDASSPQIQNQIASSWKYIERPQITPRLHGLKIIREMIQKNGLTIVADCRHLKASHADIEKMYGGKVICWDKFIDQETITSIKGVAIHPSGVEYEVYALNRFRGEINPHLGFGVLSKMLVGDRAIEFQTTEAIWPHIMPKAVTYSELREKEIVTSEMEQKRTQLRAELQKIVRGEILLDKAKRAQLREELKLVVSDILNSVQKYYPSGAFAKNYGESTTGDLGNQIKTFHFNIDNIVDQYMDGLISSLGTEIIDTSKKDQSVTTWRSFLGREDGSPNMTFKSIDSENFQKAITAAYYNTGTKFVNKLFTDPENVLFQDRVKIAQSDLGFNREIRVDYVDGEPVNARGRYSHEYTREDEEEAKVVLKKFFERAPEEFKYMSGGADLAKLENGRWVIIEFNTGPNSGSIHPTTFPIEANRFISSLQGKNTPLLDELESKFASSLEEQRAYLKSFKTEEDKWHKGSLQDISLAEVGKYFRDRYLDEWRKNPTAENAKDTLVKIKALFGGIGSKLNRDLPLLIRGAENYLNAKLEI